MGAAPARRRGDPLAGRVRQGCAPVHRVAIRACGAARRGVLADLLRLHAVPYFATGNRGGTGMRVWLPVAPAEMPLADAAPEQAVAGGGGGSS